MGLIPSLIGRLKPRPAIARVCVEDGAEIAGGECPFFSTSFETWSQW